jgi:hypothetical protein
MARKIMRDFLTQQYEWQARSPSTPRKSLGLDFPGRIHGPDAFFGEPGKQHSDCRHVLFDRGGATWR